MKRLLFLTGALLLLVSSGFSQALYQREVLLDFGLDEDEVEEVQDVVAQTAREIARLEAELNIKKAELARLLLEDNPPERQIERNLTSAAELEAQRRMAEIRRELAIREIVGTDRWTQLVRVVREHLADTERTIAGASREIIERLATAQRALTERQEEIARRLRQTGDEGLARELGEQLLAVQQEYRELIETLRARL
jgi:septal ring factor EnvC (AmiA/AmiB activator)